jgi:hypothetical protein
MPERDHLVQVGRWTDKHVHEGHDADVRVVSWVGVGLMAMVFVSGLIVAMMMNIMGTPDYRSPPRLPVPVPHLQDRPLADIAALRREKQAMLQGYGWIDRERGVVHIPIGLAMDKLATTPMGLARDGGEGRP